MVSNLRSSLSSSTWESKKGVEMSNSYKISGSGEVVILAVIPLKGKKEVPGNEIIIIIQGSKNRKKNLCSSL